MWQPTCELKVLEARAKFLRSIRAFFEKKSVLEVETPLLSQFGNPEPCIQSFQTQYLSTTCYLQTSPEFPMKRLLAFGSGSIYQISKAFRDDEYGRFHNPEFTILEWYRTGFDYHQLMDEMEEFLQAVSDFTHPVRFTYKDLFEKMLSFDPHQISLNELKPLIQKYNIEISDNHTLTKDDYLNLLLSHCIEPELKKMDLVFIFDYPASQSALAKIIEKNNISVAARFEVYYRGIELANGFDELTDAKEQTERFEQQNLMRKQMELPLIPIDKNLLAALNEMPQCAGVALGIDRLLMCKLQKTKINDVLTFDIHHA